MAINKTTTETKNKIKANSVIALPNRPQIPAEQLKQAFVKPIVDTSNSMIQELDRIVEETNAELEQVQVDITDAIDEHNTNTEATHLDIRQEITDLENDLQEQIDGIDDALQNHESRIGELELFAGNLETNITEEIEDALENKADLVDGKVPREQLPSFVDDIIEGFYINGQFYSEGEESPEYLITPEFGKLYVEVDTNKMYRVLGGTYEEIPSPFELTKAKVEAVLTGDITSHNHATEIGNHNTSETAHTGIRNAVAEAKAIAEGKSRARVFATESALNTWLSNPENVALLQIGDNFYIEETDKPDYWWNGTTIKELETQKVDLTEYAKKTDIPDITVNNGSAESGKYISQIAVDAIDKHKLNITKENLPTLRPTIELEVASLTTLTEAEKLAIKNTLSSLIVDDKIDGTKFDDIVLVTTNDLIRLHYSSIDYYVENPQITVIFETQSTKYILNVPVAEYTYSTLTSTTTYTKTEIDAMFDNLLGGEY